MKVILLENIRKIGSIGEIIDVKRGFARNYLISKKKALFASKTNIKEVELIKQDLNKKDQEKKKQAKSREFLPWTDPNCQLYKKDISSKYTVSVAYNKGAYQVISRENVKDIGK